VPVPAMAWFHARPSTCHLTHSHVCLRGTLGHTIYSPRMGYHLPLAPTVPHACLVREECLQPSSCLPALPHALTIPAGSARLWPPSRVVSEHATSCLLSLPILASSLYGLYLPSPPPWHWTCAAPVSILFGSYRCLLYYSGHVARLPASLLLLLWDPVRGAPPVRAARTSFVPRCACLAPAAFSSCARL